MKIGTRGSPLALAQAYETRTRLGRVLGLPESAFEVVVIQTTGDRVQDRPLGEIGGKGLFTKEIEEAMLSGDIDIAVHSMKDMPVDCPDGLTLNCFLPREDVRDAFICNKAPSLADLPAGSVVGTSSLRRRAQLIHTRPDLNVVEFRGNVQTRLRKLKDGVADATFLAVAGLNRLNRSELITAAVPVTEMLPAIAQGAIGIEWRTNDAECTEALALINDAGTATRLAAERALLRGLDGSCQTPIGGLAELSGNQLRLRGQVLRPDGSESVEHEMIGPASKAAEIGAEMAAILKDRMGGSFF
jgi:hydroxymethylbilane synthase